MNKLAFIFLFATIAVSCSPFSRKARRAANVLISSPALKGAHAGICIYEPASDRYLYTYQADKYFVPASNTKILTCYEAMKHLKDSLVGLRYSYNRQTDTYEIFPTGDPTFLHNDFGSDKILNFFIAHHDQKFLFHTEGWNETAWGTGWSWDDYEGDYMAERSPFPIYGNVVQFQKALPIKNFNTAYDSVIGTIGLKTIPDYFKSRIEYNPDIHSYGFSIHRHLNSNLFYLLKSAIPFTSDALPFITDNETFIKLLSDTTGMALNHILMGEQKETNDHSINKNSPVYSQIYSRPLDTMLRLMMYRSDNFYAEQSLLMVSNEMLGVMSDEKIIDTLLRSDLKELPQKPHWVDGSGLSRYNMFTPYFFIYLLNKMQKEFGMERMKKIFPTGNTGSLKNYFKDEEGYIYAKTGSMSHVVGLSGFLYARSGKLLLFSVLVNNNLSSITEVRRAVESFLIKIWEKE